LDVVYYDPPKDHDSYNSQKININNPQREAWQNGRWDYGDGYYALQKDVPKGTEYSTKAKLNHMKMELEMMERKAA